LKVLYFFSFENLVFLHFWKLDIFEIFNLLIGVQGGVNDYAQHSYESEIFLYIFFLYKNSY